MHATGGLSTDSAGVKEHVGRWLYRAGLVEHPLGVATYQLQQALQLAEGIRACISARMDRKELPEAGLSQINRWAAVPAFPQLDRTAGVFWCAHRPVEGALARIALDAVHLLSSEAAFRIRRCQGCGVVFVDHSPAGNARWCSMKRCGNRAKVGRYRRRRASASEVSESS